MVDWLERARREIPESVDRDTTVTDNRNPMAVMAVPQPAKSENPGSSIVSNGSIPKAVLSKIEETAIRDWLAYIKETDPEIIAEIMDRCRSDPEARAYFLGRSGEVPVDPIDDRRHCRQCRNLIAGGLCLAAQRKEIKASLYPMDNLPRRCEGYLPKPNDPGQRVGRQRWPGLNWKKMNPVGTP
uniref:Uncharacterized protein n=1 Tax=Candidatus Kentrum sp. FW TaxID=2126338 RepID=A0A450T0I0_9GAMM|nr:MAG: hypothetical protein BECKFW1821B_GA0114236_105017 [Candidatus Kentron sp. FW]